MKKLLLCYCVLVGMIGNSYAQTDTIYGLNFTTGQLRFAKASISTGQVTVVSPNVMTPDIFQQGVADFNPNTKVYYYTRGGSGGNNIVTVDTKTGTVLHNHAITPSNGAVAPITNIAYNWLNDTLYGLNYQYNNGEELRLVSVDPTTGNLNMISANPVSKTPFLSGNSDIDPIHRRYFYATSNRIYTVNLDDGTIIYDRSLTFPTFTGNRFLVNLTYDWQNNVLYGLFMSPNPSGGFGSILRLVSVDPANGLVTLISSSALSPDGFSMGDCDIDPVNQRYFYVRQNMLYTVDITTGNLISIKSLSNPNSAISPIGSIAYDDFSKPPALPIIMNMGDSLNIEQGDTLALDAYVDDNATYLWSTGATTPTIQATKPGIYDVEIWSKGLKIEGSIAVKAKKPFVFINTDTGETLTEQSVKIYPNPARSFLQIDWQGISVVESLSVINAVGQEVKVLQQPQPNTQMDVSQLPNGVYFLEIRTEGKVFKKQFVVQR